MTWGWLARWQRRAEIAASVAFLAVLVFVAWILPAPAHDWYPASCCNEQDCRPYPSSFVTRGPDGWRLHDGTVVPFEAARPSPDRQFHRCDWSNGKMIIMGSPCFWAPGAEG